METLNNTLAEELASMVTQLQRTFLLELTAKLDQENLSLVQYTTLGLLNDANSLNMSQLAKATNHLPPAMVGIVDRLVAAGLADRYTHPDDRRQVLVRISEKGRSLLDRMKRHTTRNIQGVFQDLNQGDIETWLRVYRTIRQRSVVALAY